MSRCRIALFSVALITAWGTPVPGQQTPTTPKERDGIFRQYAPGLLARVNYEAAAPGRFRVSVWDLLVGPGKASEAVKLPGGAVLEVRSGSGRALINGQAREISGGATFIVDEGSSLALTNGRDDLALALRVTLISLATP